jgi:Protein of unknown function (DUF1236)
MTNRFMMSVAAAALIAGTGLANAQGTGSSREAPSAGSTVQQSAPSSDRGAPSAAPMNRDGAPDAKGVDKGADKGMKATQSDEKMPPGAAKNQRAQEDMKPAAKGEKSAQDGNLKGEKSKSMSSETQEKGAAGKDMKAEDRNGMKAEGRDGKNAESKGAVDSKTTGQAGAGAKLSTEQRTKITTVIKEQRVQPVTNVNFSISVGTRVPRSGITFHPLPAEIVTVYPQWRGYEYILVRDQILVIDPRSGEIVDVIDT